VAAAADGGFYELHEPDRPLALATPLTGHPEPHMNDGGVDPASRFLAGSMAYDDRPRVAAPYVLARGTARPLLSDVTISNGIE
jgi:sugar lactone lactonase YvrE